MDRLGLTYAIIRGYSAYNSGRGGNTITINPLYSRPFGFMGVAYTSDASQRTDTQVFETAVQVSCFAAPPQNAYIEVQPMDMAHECVMALRSSARVSDWRENNLYPVQPGSIRLISFENENGFWEQYATFDFTFMHTQNNVTTSNPVKDIRGWRYPYDAT